MRKSVLLALLVFVPISFAHSQVPAIERAALIALYDATNGAAWTDNTDWLGAEGTECTWYVCRPQGSVLDQAEKSPVSKPSQTTVSTEPVIDRLQYKPPEMAT